MPSQCPSRPVQGPQPAHTTSKIGKDWVEGAVKAGTAVSARIKKVGLITGELLKRKV